MRLKNSIINAIQGLIIGKDDNCPEIILEDIIFKNFLKLISHKMTGLEYKVKFKQS